MHWFNQQV